MKKSLTLVVNNGKSEPMNALEWNALIERLRIRRVIQTKREELQNVKRK